MVAAGQAWLVAILIVVVREKRFESEEKEVTQMRDRIK